MLSLNRAELLEAHFGVPAPRRRAVRHQHAARAARGALHRRALRRAGAAARSRARGLGGPGRSSFPGCASCGSAPSTRRCSRARAPTRARLARQRGSPDRGRLHERHDRHAQGRRLHAPRRVPRRARRSRRDTPRARTAPISGRCPCSTATAGASAGACAGVGATSVVLRRPEPGGGLARAARRRDASVRGADGADLAASRTPTRRRSTTW